MCHFWNYFTFLSFAYFFSSNFVHTPFVSFFQGSFLPTYYFSKKRLQRNWGNVFVLVPGYKEGTIQSFQLLCLIDSFVIMIWFRWEFSLKENTEAGFKWSKAEFFVQRNILLVRATFFSKINWGMNHPILSGRGTWARRAHWTSSTTSRRTHCSGFSGRQGTSSHYQKIDLGMVSWGKEYILSGIAGMMGGRALPWFFGSISRIAFLVNKRSLFLPKCQ